MKAFEFSFEKLLAAKESLKKAGEVRLAEATRELGRRKAVLIRLERETRRQVLAMASVCKSETDGRELTANQLYLSDLEVRQGQQRNRMQESLLLVDEMRSELMNMVRELKSFENLKTRERRQWVQVWRRADRKEMDEIAATAFVRRGSALVSGCGDM